LQNSSCSLATAPLDDIRTLDQNHKCYFSKRSLSPCRSRWSFRCHSRRFRHRWRWSPLCPLVSSLMLKSAGCRGVTTSYAVETNASFIFHNRRFLFPLPGGRRKQVGRENTTQRCASHTICITTLLYTMYIYISKKPYICILICI
jgi:hypothetical protein